MYKSPQEEKEIANYTKYTYTMVVVTILSLIISWKTHVEFFDVEEFNKSSLYVDGILNHVEDKSLSGEVRGLTVNVKYTFDVNGTKYDGNNLGYIDYPLTITAQTIRDTLDKYGLKKGNIIRVHYNINDPNQSMLFLSQDSNSKDRIIMLIIAIISAIAAYYCFRKLLTLKN